MKAVEFAYKAVRKSPDILEANLAMILAFSLPEGLTLAPATPAIVDVGAAVEYRDGNDGESTWCIVEDAADVRPVLGEISAKGELANAMRGHCVGESFSVPSAFGPPKLGTILKIQNRYVYRYQECMSEFPKRFPDQKVFTKINVPTKPDGTMDFSEFNLQLQFLHEQQERAVKDYLSHQITLHMMENAVGGGIAGAVSALCAARDGVIFCADGSLNSRNFAMRALGDAQLFVLDLTGAVTLFLLLDSFSINVSALLSAMKIPGLISEYTVADLKALLEQIDPKHPRLGTRRLGNMVVPTFSEAESSRRSFANLGTLVETLERFCTVTPGSTLASIPAESREQLVGVCGRAAVESAILSQRENAILWTDDIASYAVLSEHLPVPRIWTQLSAFHALNRKELDENLFSDISLGLLRLRYRFTFLTPTMAMRAAEAAKWMVSDEPLRSVMDVVGDKDLDIETLKPTLGLMLKHVWTAPALAWHAEHFMQRVLDRLGSRPKGRELVIELGRSVDKLMGLYVIPAMDMKRLVELWLRVNADPREL